MKQGHSPPILHHYCARLHEGSNTPPSIAGDEAGIRRDEEDDCFGEFLWTDETPDDDLEASAFISKLRRNPLAWFQLEADCTVRAQDIYGGCPRFMAFLSMLELIAQ